MADRAVAVPARPARAHPTTATLVAGTSLATRLTSLLLVAAAGATLVALSDISTDPRYAFDPTDTLDAIAGQLGATALPAVLIAATTLANLVAGAILVRLLTAEPYRSLADALLAGFGGAVILDAAMLFLLGAFGVFVAPLLVLVHVALYAASRWARPLARGVRLGLPRDVPLAWWPLVVVVWLAPVALTLASPAVPFMDVLPNHVAPVEHLRAYGSFDTLTVMPSPIYGPSRLFLGYVGMLGTLSVLTDLQAVLAVSMFAVPAALLCAVAAHRLAATLFGRRAGFWALLTFPLTFVFLRIPDARATVVVFPIAAWALTLVVLGLRERPLDEKGAAAAAIGLAIAFGAAILMHPVVGAAAIATAAIATLLRPEKLARLVVPAAAGAAAVALPQLWAMLDFSMPSWMGLPALALGLALASGIALVEWRDTLVRPLAAVALALIAVALVLGSRFIVPAVSDVTNNLVTLFPLLAATTIGAAVLLRRRADGWIVAGSALAVGIAVDAACQVVPGDSLLEQSLKFEVPKTIAYWAPVFLAIVAAGALGALSRMERPRPTAGLAPAAVGAIRFAALAAIVAVAAVPLLEAPKETIYDITERSYAVSVADNLLEAERGYWAGYRDARLIVDADGQAVVDFLRDEQHAGRLGSDTPVLHIAKSFQQWVSIPVGVFTGAIETTVTLDPERSIHTAGGRLYGFDDLPRLLRSSRYVVYEPAGLPDDYAPQILGAGFRQVYANGTAFVFVRS